MNIVRKNLLIKYNLDEQELEEGIQIVAETLGRLTDVQVMMAIADLLATGDIEESTGDD